MYSLESKLVNIIVQEMSWPLVQSSRGVWAFFPLFFFNVNNEMVLCVCVYVWVCVTLTVQIPSLLLNYKIKIKNEIKKFWLGSIIP